MPVPLALVGTRCARSADHPGPRPPAQGRQPTGPGRGVHDERVARPPRGVRPEPPALPRGRARGRPGEPLPARGRRRPRAVDTAARAVLGRPGLHGRRGDDRARVLARARLGRHLPGRPHRGGRGGRGGCARILAVGGRGREHPGPRGRRRRRLLPRPGPGTARRRGDERVLRRAVPRRLTAADPSRHGPRGAPEHARRRRALAGDRVAAAGPRLGDRRPPGRRAHRRRSGVDRPRPRRAALDPTPARAHPRGAPGRAGDPGTRGDAPHGVRGGGARRPPGRHRCRRRPLARGGGCRDRDGIRPGGDHRGIPRRSNPFRAGPHGRLATAHRRRAGLARHRGERRGRAGSGRDAVGVVVR